MCVHGHEVNIPAQDFTVMLAADGVAREGRTDAVRCSDGATTNTTQNGKGFRWDAVPTTVEALETMAGLKVRGRSSAGLVLYQTIRQDGQRAPSGLHVL